MKYILDFKDDTDKISIDQYLNEYNCEILKVYDNFLKVYLIESDTIPPMTDIIESIINDDEIEISPLGEIVPFNKYFLTSNPNLPSITFSVNDDENWWKVYSIQDWSTVYDNKSKTNSISRKGNGVNVYIMDSGIKNSHPDLSNSEIINLFSFTDSYEDVNGHGTAIASIISGESCGLTNATLKIVKIFDRNHITKQSDVIYALDTILSDFLINPKKAAILNCSWQIAKNSYIESKIRFLINQGIKIIAAAGNSGMPIENVTPASMSEVFVIGSYNKALEPSDFSNYSNESIIENNKEAVNTGQLDGWAPGEQIRVATLEGEYGYANGTSMSAAIATCILAYNISDILYDDYTLPEFYQKPREDDSAIKLWFLSRPQILDLTNPKYFESENYIVTLATSSSSHLVQELDYYAARIKSGVLSRVVTIFNSITTKKVEIVDPLPNGFYLDLSGTIAGSYELSNGEVRKIFESLIQITDIFDEIRNVKIQIGIIASNFDEAQIQPDDPILSIPDSPIKFQPLAQDTNPGGFAKL
jgi:subtilisin family serine protease